MKSRALKIERLSQVPQLIPRIPDTEPHASLRSRQDRQDRQDCQGLHEQSAPKGHLLKSSEEIIHLYYLISLLAPMIVLLMAEINRQADVL